jgi:orotidine-5'-phosphate decarboxylase
MACDLILALDAPSPREFLPVLRQLQGTLRWVKVGLEMYSAGGPDAVREVAALGFDVFLDLKLHDIPNTVAKAVESVSALPVKLLTLHTAGGPEMMRRAVEAQRQHAPHLALLGVTVLTSMSEGDLRAIGVPDSTEQQVLRLGQLAVRSGLRGLVCSPLELPILRQQLPADVRLVTPGVRPTGAAAGDQTRIMTPGAAARAGASAIVVGRPIYQAADPAAAARAILTELGEAGAGHNL